MTTYKTHSPSTTECHKADGTYLPVEWVRNVREARHYLSSVLWGQASVTLPKRQEKALVKALATLNDLESQVKHDDDPFA